MTVSRSPVAASTTMSPPAGHSGVLRTTLKEELGRIDAATLRKAHGILESGKSVGKLVLTGF